MKILLVEDNEQLNKALSTLLKRNSFIVDSAFDGEEALLFIKDYAYDAIVLDIMLPRIDGLEVLRRTREAKIPTPILMLTAKSTTEDKVAGLDLGADDYLAKPFNIDELMARIRALLRRKPTYEESPAVEFGDLKLNLDNSTLVCGKAETVLTNKEMQIMKLLLESKGNIVSLDKIVNGAWNVDESSSSENLWVFISYLRRKMESIGSKTTIKSIRYQGYCLHYEHD